MVSATFPFYGPSERPVALVDGTPRPANTQLDVRATEALFEGTGFEGQGWNGFEEWWTAYLQRPY